jgi:hypothetical protein
LIEIIDNADVNRQRMLSFSFVGPNWPGSSPQNLEGDNRELLQRVDGKRLTISLIDHLRVNPTDDYLKSATLSYTAIPFADAPKLAVDFSITMKNGRRLTGIVTAEADSQIAAIKPKCGS